MTTTKDTPVPDLLIENEDEGHRIVGDPLRLPNGVFAKIATKDGDGDYSVAFLDLGEMKQLRGWLNLCIESAEKHQRETL